MPQYIVELPQNLRLIHSPNFLGYQSKDLFGRVESSHPQSRHPRADDTSSYSRSHSRPYYSDHPPIPSSSEGSGAEPASVHHLHAGRLFQGLHRMHSRETNLHTYHPHRWHHRLHFFQPTLAPKFPDQTSELVQQVSLQLPALFPLP